MLDASRRFVLKNRTAQAHAELEHMVGNIDSLSSYTRYLRGLHGFRMASETRLSRAERAFGNWRPTMISSLMAQDLVDLGVQPLAGIAAPAFARERSALFGLAYLLEGSGLGARLLWRQAQAIGLSAEHGARHLARQAAAIDNWKSFIQTLDEAADIDIEKAADAANAAFRDLQRFFERQNGEE